jgi:hypothetical protein
MLNSGFPMLDVMKMQSGKGIRLRQGFRLRLRYAGQDGGQAPAQSE